MGHNPPKKKPPDPWSLMARPVVPPPAWLAAAGRKGWVHVAPGGKSHAASFSMDHAMDKSDLEASKAAFEKLIGQPCAFLETVILL